MSTKLVVGNTWSRIEGLTSREIHNVGAALQKILTVEVPGAKFLWAFKSGQWDGRVRLFNLTEDATGFSFLTGLTGLVTKTLNSDFTLSCAEYIPIPRRLNNYTVPLRPYQHEVLSAAFSNILWVNGTGCWWPRGILQVATGGGKTEIAVAMYQSYPVETVFLVHRKDLLIQAAERFKKYGIHVGVIGANDFNPSHGLNIMTMQTLLSIMKRNNDDSRKTQVAHIVANAKQVFFDEAHIMASSQDKGNQFVEVGSWFTKAHARWGLTATPFMRGQYDNLLLQGVTGDVLAYVSSEYLIKNGYLTAPKVTMIKVPGLLPMTINFKASTKARAEYWRTVEYKGVVVNDWRNNRIGAEIAAGPHPCMALVKTIEQANAIQRMAKMYNSNVPIVDGSWTAQQRRDIVKGLRTGQVPAIIATTIFDEGIDIPEIRKVILGSGGKSQVKLLQRVGRGLRTAAGKHDVEIIDFGDQHHSMLKKHALLRMGIWKEQGFEVKESA